MEQKCINASGKFAKNPLLGDKFKPPMKSQAGPHNGQVSIGVGGMNLDVSLDPSSLSPLTSTGIT
jgi:hypothetical protein